MASLLSWIKSFSGLMLVLFYIAATSDGYIVDLTLVTNHPLLDPPNTQDQYIGAYLGQKDASIRDDITFDRIIRTADTPVLPKYINIEDEGQFIRKLIFEQSNQTKALGAFNATFEYDGIKRMTSIVVLMHNATVLPERTTLTVHAGETVTIAVVTNMTEGSLRWGFNGEKISDNNGKQSLTLENVELNQTGVYKCFLSGKRSDPENAIFLLHVIRCPAHRWGSGCAYNCTECLNGGKCDADSGECVCPPGFNGTTCEHVLGRNRFGQDGSFSCDSSGDDHSPECRGKLFCLPDPFGCTCAAGFMGINCTTECNPGTYGANCLQECHCSSPNICTKDTGVCIDGTACQEGWTGVNCQVRSSPIQDVEDDTSIPGTKSASSGTTSSIIPTIETTSDITEATTSATTPAPTTIPPQSVPSYAIASFNYTKVNNGEPTTLVCVVTGSPLPTSENISVTYAAGGDEGIVLLGTTVNESTRTSRYQVIVSLGEVPLNFTCLLRRPDGESVSKDVAVSVYEPPSFVEAHLLVQEMTSHSITLRWTPWNENNDRGNGPVIGYRVYYNTHGQDDIASASGDLIRDTNFTITNLTRDTVYDFRVTASREGPSGEGRYISVAGTRTKCTAPSQAPVLSVRNRGQTSITLDREVIPEGSWGCSALSGLEINISTNGQNGLPRTLSFDTTAGTANIDQLEDCTTYNINAAFRNKDELGISSEILSVSTSLIRPARVEALQMSSSTTQIGVSWALSSSLCSPDYYSIRYSLLRKFACQSPETTPSEFEVNTNVTQYNNLVGLEPYSRYKITVTAVNGAGQSEPTIGYSYTRPGPPSNITHARVNPERTSPSRIGFTWQPLNCRNVNGVFWYYYTRIYKDGDRDEKQHAGSKYLDYNISYSSVEFNDLDACTVYELNINAVNSRVTTLGNLSYAIGVTGVTFTNASASATGNQPGLTVQWSVPHQCNVNYYRLSYHLISRKACQDAPVIDAPVYESNVTSVSKYISNLEYYATYNISIIAVIMTAESLPININGDTGDGVPSVIKSVSYTSTAHSLDLVWEEPSCESLHGVLNRYEYDLYGGQRTARYALHTRRNDVQITGLDACTEYRFRIRVVTTQQRRSEWHMEMATTNISAPGMPLITELTAHREDSGTTGLTVTWQPPSSPPCQPTHYEIKYYVRQGDMCENIPSDPTMNLAGTVNGSTFTFSFLELRPNSEYMVFVRGGTSSGYGDSDSQSATTGYSYPTGPPTNIQSASTKKRSIVFTWDKPECGNRSGPISSYEVMLSNYTGGVVYYGNVSAGAASAGYKISDLIPYSNYSIRIRAWNYELAGEYGPAIRTQTDEAKPAPPIGVKLPSSDQGSITVEWMSPNPPLGRIIGYHIQYWETFGNGSTPRNLSFPCQDRLCSDINYTFSTIIPHLQPDTNYSVQVRAETIRGVGDSSPDPPAVRITSEGIPSEPQALAVSSRSKSLLITWKEPRYPRGKIINYTLAYKVKGKPYDISFQPEDSFTMKKVAGASLSFELDDLEPATLYEVYVVASTSKGKGESSQHVEGFTKPPAAEELPMPNPPVIVSSPDGSPTIQFSDELESPYITHILVAVEERLPVARRRRQQAAYGSFAENPSSYITASISKDGLPIELTIGDNETYGNYHNAPLKDKAIYDVRTGVESNVGGMKSTLFGDSTEVKTGPTGGGSSVVPVVVGVIFALLLVAVVVVGVLYYRKRRGKFSRLPASILRPRRTPPVRTNNRNQFNDNVPMRQVHSLGRGGTLLNAPSVDGLSNAADNGEDGAIYANLQPEENAHQPIPLDQLITYVAQKKASTKNGFKQDYESIPGGQLHPLDVAKKIENKQKNRYINIIAYDHSRVQLPLLENDPHSDYVNANFIDGYNYPRRYIAAQGPNVASVKDFWRMVWEEDCGKIVMLTNTVEGEKRKCEKYWPDKKMIYGKITVTRKSEEVNTHYTVRTFSVVFGDNIREVVQFHYTSWPDMGVPKYTTPLMNFIRTVKQHHTNSVGAIVVHCSAGVGRTGTFITLDAMLDQAEAENAIDVYNFITGMRQNRIKMVQVAEQYQFIYDALLETFVCGDTSIAQDLYLQRYPSLLAPSPDTGSTLLQEQFERLDMFTIKPRDDELRTARNSMNVHKNRYHDKLPTDKSRPYLITEVENGTNYINASFLPGYTKKDMFLGTQTPLPNTVGDFWRLVFDYKISTIIMLNGLASKDQSMAEYWPDESESEVTFGPFTITLIDEEHYDEISCRTMELRSTTSKSRVQTVYQLQLTTWPITSEICASAISFMELHRRAMVWNEANAKDAPIMVHCKDGEGATGTFCSLSSVLERLNVEKLVDVFQACKRVRAIRRGAVASLAQYEFIHSVLRLYLDSYDIYENYRT
eukprot:XP_011672386.1 PREDICTED: receptor-type tyrosine-protein phosphatase F isoform X1 [Strongylocentrotus purpuratus]